MIKSNWGGLGRWSALVLMTSLAGCAGVITDGEGGEGDDDGTSVEVGPGVTPTGTTVGTDTAAGTGVATGTGTGVMPTSCEWPAGSPGVGVGNTMPAMSWSGYAPSSDATGSVYIEDLYDCDGSKGITALYFVTAQLNCGACQNEAGGLEAQAAQWEAQGIRVITVMLNADGGVISNWKNTFGLHRVGVVADGQFDMIPPGVSTVGTPWHTIVDARTMEVVAQGPQASPGLLMQVAQGNM